MGTRPPPKVPIERILRLIRRFTHARTGSTIPELVREFQVSRRTVYRDLRLLERAGFRLEGLTADNEPRKRWRLTEGQRRHTDTVFTDEELMSMYFCVNLLSPLRGTPLRQGLEAALQKIESTFGPRDRERFADLVFTHVARLGPHKDYAPHAATLGALSRACLDRRRVRLTYRAAVDGETKTYAFHPYCLAWSGGELYTIGHSELRGDVRTLRIDRIARLELAEGTFDRPRDFDPEEYLLRGFGIYAEGELEKVKIEFSGKAAAAVRDKEWHPTQRIEDGPDGRVIVKMTVQGLSEVARWVLYHAPQAKVLEPASLREMVAGLSAEVRNLHQ